MTTPIVFPGANVLLEGTSGSGKTYSLHTLVESGLEIFYLDIDNSLETILGYWADKGLPIPPNFHWHHLTPKTQGFKSMMATADAVGKYNMDVLAKIKDTDRHLNNQFLSLLEILNDFTDQRDGKSYGPVDSWGSDRVLVMDSFTALHDITFDMVVGARPMRDKPDYGIGQTNEMNLIKKLCKGCNCHFVLIAHIDRVADEFEGGMKIFPHTLGKATISELPIPFSDVIMAKTNGKEWFWSTSEAMADLKTRNLTYSSKLPADFREIIKTWSRRRDAAVNAGKEQT